MREANYDKLLADIKISYRLATKRYGVGYTTLVCTVVVGDIKRQLVIGARVYARHGCGARGTVGVIILL